MKGKPRTQTDEGSLTPRFPEKSVSDLFSCFSRVSFEPVANNRMSQQDKRQVQRKWKRQVKGQETVKKESPKGKDAQKGKNNTKGQRAVAMARNKRKERVSPNNTGTQVAHLATLLESVGSLHKAEL